MVAEPTSTTEKSSSAGVATPISGGIRSTNLVASIYDRVSHQFLCPNVETILYFVIFAAAVATRFYDLGSRPLHHDESLHAFYSWLYYSGQGYVHDPMMHGPFLFHINALVYVLLGASDFTARVAPALFGVAMVMLPMWLRRELGRWGALFASFLFLISPTFLYYSRFIRNDIYCAVWAMIMLIAFVKYARQPSARYLVAGLAATSLLFATKETSYITIFIFVTFLILAALWKASRPAVAALGAYAVIALAVVMVLPQVISMPVLPDIPVDTPTAAAIMTYISSVLQHPLIIMLILITLAGGGTAAWLLARQRSRLVTLSAEPNADGSTGWNPIRTTADIFRNPIGLGAALAVALGIFFVLYTSLFTNISGIGTGLIGALGYWLAQHGVERGHQPWFYYLLLMPLYEPLTVVLVIGGAVSGAVGLLSKKVRRAVTDAHSRVLGGSPAILVFLWYWLILGTAIYSWAGEKMPWLVLHLVQPLTLIAALYAGRFFAKHLGENGEMIRTVPRGVWAVVAGASIIGVWLVVGLNSESFLTEIGWQLFAGALASLLIGGIIASLFLPVRTVLLGLVAAGLLLGAGQHIHSAWNYAYENGATPVEMGIYVQTSPDVTRVMRGLDRMSTELGRERGLEVAYDDTVSWPMEWYLRDYKDKRFLGNAISSEPKEPIVLLGAEKQDKAAQYMTNYVEQKYVLRWWFPEPTYRRFVPEKEYSGTSFVSVALDQIRLAAGTIWTMTDPVERSKLWRYFTYRQPYDSLGSTDFVLYVRRDIVPYWYSIQNDLN